VWVSAAPVYEGSLTENLIVEMTKSVGHRVLSRCSWPKKAVTGPNSRRAGHLQKITRGPVAGGPMAGGGTLLRALLLLTSALNRKSGRIKVSPNICGR